MGLCLTVFGLENPNFCSQLERIPGAKNLTNFATVVWIPSTELSWMSALGFLASMRTRNNTAIARQLEAYLEGAIGGSILEATENLPLRVRVDNAQRADLSQIASLNLSSDRPEDNNFRSTSALGEFNFIPELANIARYDEQRVNTVQGYITAGVLPSDVLANFQEHLKAENFQLPTGYRYEFGGEQEESSQAQGNLALYAPILLVVMMTALVLSLGSFRQAGIVAAVAVGCIGMALFSLRVSGAPLGFIAIVGTMGLVGIAINDTVIVTFGFK